ncbi:hypothetical protein LDENG_00179290 [Lucifuga dentata]|nr:hypothetical protein LDENG_00179290 [Lucifuga dentata]
MTSSEDPEKISDELDCLSQKMQQIQERRQTLRILQELGAQEQFAHSEPRVSKQHEIDSIDEELRQLSERKAALQNLQDKLLNAKHHNKEDITYCDKAVPAGFPESVFVVDPPSYPAPIVYMDLDKIPAYPCKTQCPECGSFITTEVVSSVSTMTWLACCATAVMGCVAGCCLIPFCIDKFKTTTHKCPKCRTSLCTIKAL